MQKLGKNDLINEVAEKTGIGRKDVARMMNQTLESLTEHLSAGDDIQLTGFGSFEVRERKARTGVRPGTSERIEIPASKYPAFKPGKALKDNIQAHA